MARHDPQMNIRIPADMAAWLRETAARERRTITQTVLMMIDKEMRATKEREAGRASLPLNAV